MAKIPFYKMTGCGNDFIIIDNRRKILDADKLGDLVQKVCAHKLSAGADGLILIEPSEKVNFKWRFFNSDGSEAAMCGNGSRCAARFAVLLRGDRFHHRVGADARRDARQLAVKHALAVITAVGGVRAEVRIGELAGGDDLDRGAEALRLLDKSFSEVQA